MANAERIARRIERRTLASIREHALLDGHARLLLAVSGGPDSLALMQILARLAPALSIACAVAYIDHGIRPAAVITAEREGVARAAAGLDLPFLSARAERPAGRRSPEAAAREGRYRALARLAAEAGAMAVATGHTASDQAETVLLRLIRGSGLHGLAAMALAAPWPVGEGPALLRPLLSLSRADTVAYCAALGLTPAVDAENANPRYQRNQVRAELLPLLRRFNPNVEQALTRLAMEAGEWRRAQAGAEETAASAVQITPEGVHVSLAALQEADHAARIALLRRAWQAALPDRAGPSRAHLEALLRLVRGGSGEVMLPDGIVARRGGAQFLIGRAPGPTARVSLFEVSVIVPGVTALPGWHIESALVDGGEAVRDEPLGERWDVLIDARHSEGLTVGPRRPGDRIELAGMAGRKRLQDLFVDAKTPRGDRATWPVFRTPRGVLWVAGFRPAAWARTGGGALRLRVRRDEP